MGYFLTGNQQHHFVCVACRVCTKCWVESLHKAEPPPLCAQCGGEMVYVGKKFAAPRRRDDASWKKLTWMIQNGWRGTNWPISPDMNLNQVRESLRENREAHSARVKRVTDEISFQNVAQRARHNARNRRKARARKNARRELKAQQEYQDAVLARIAKRESE